MISASLLTVDAGKCSFWVHFDFIYSEKFECMIFALNLYTNNIIVTVATLALTAPGNEDDANPR